MLDGHRPRTARRTSSACRPSGAACWPRSPGGRTHDVSRCARCLGSSDTLPWTCSTASWTRFDAEVYVTYGLTEAGCILTYARLTRDDRTKINAVGRPHPLVEVCSVDARQGEVGEVLARGPTLMDGLLGACPSGRPRPSSRGLAAHRRPRSLRRRRAVSCLAGRAKDMIVSGGEKVYPLEVES